MNIKKAKKRVQREIDHLFEAVDNLEVENKNLLKKGRSFEKRYLEAEFRIGVLEAMLEETLLELRDCEDDLERSNLANVALRMTRETRPLLRMIKSVPFVRDI